MGIKDDYALRSSIFCRARWVHWVLFEEWWRGRWSPKFRARNLNKSRAIYEDT